MLNKKSVGDYIFDTINVVILFILSVICLYPLIYVLFASVSNPIALIRHEGIMFAPVGGFTLKGYELVFKNPNIITGYYNTFFYVIVGTALSMLFTCVAAYVLSRKNVKYTKYIMYMIVFTMFFGGGLIPFYLLIKNIGLYNTRWAVVLPGLIATWNLIIMRTSFMQLPISLEESAKIDGANEYNILFKIIIPVSKPVIAVIALFYAVAKWNEWFNPMIFLQDNDKFPLQLVLRSILISNDKNSMLVGGGFSPEQEDMYKQLLQYSTIIVATVPILLVYPFLQKYFVKGIMIGAIKG